MSTIQLFVVPAVHAQGAGAVTEKELVTAVCAWLRLTGVSA